MSSQIKSKYHRQIAPGVWVDVYDVLAAFEVTEPELQHLIKKALAAGKRGHKDYETDLQDIQKSIVCLIARTNKWKEYNKLAETKEDNTEIAGAAVGIPQRVRDQIAADHRRIIEAQRVREAQDKVHDPFQHSHLYSRFFLTQ